MEQTVRVIAFSAVSADAVVAKKGAFQATCRSAGIDYECVYTLLGYESVNLVLFCTYVLTSQDGFAALDGFDERSSKSVIPRRFDVRQAPCAEKT